jgi:hypothetical protein
MNFHRVSTHGPPIASEIARRSPIFQAAGNRVQLACPEVSDGVGSTLACRQQGCSCRSCQSFAAKNKKLAGSIVEPGQSKSSSIDVLSKGVATSADAAVTPGGTARSAAAATTAPAATATAAPATAAPAAAAAATTTTAPGHLLHGAACIFLVEKVEGGEAHVCDFLFTECDRLRRYEAQFLRRVGGRIGRSSGAARKAKSQTRSAQRRHGGFSNSLPSRSLFHSSHRRILHQLFRTFRTVPTSSSRRDHSFAVGAMQAVRLH